MNPFNIRALFLFLIVGLASKAYIKEIMADTKAILGSPFLDPSLNGFALDGGFGGRFGGRFGGGNNIYAGDLLIQDKIYNKIKKVSATKNTTSSELEAKMIDFMYQENIAWKYLPQVLASNGHILSTTEIEILANTTIFGQTNLPESSRELQALNNSLSNNRNSLLALEISRVSAENLTNSDLGNRLYTAFEDINDLSNDFFDYSDDLDYIGTYSPILDENLTESERQRAHAIRNVNNEVMNSMIMNTKKYVSLSDDHYLLKSEIQSLQNFFHSIKTPEQFFDMVDGNSEPTVASGPQDGFSYFLYASLNPNFENLDFMLEYLTSEKEVKVDELRSKLLCRNKINKPNNSLNTGTDLYGEVSQLTQNKINATSKISIEENHSIVTPFYDPADHIKLKGKELFDAVAAGPMLSVITDMCQAQSDNPSKKLSKESSPKKSQQSNQFKLLNAFITKGDWKCLDDLEEIITEFEDYLSHRPDLNCSTVRLGLTSNIQNKISLLDKSIKSLKRQIFQNKQANVQDIEFCSKKAAENIQSKALVDIGKLILSDDTVYYHFRSSGTCRSVGYRTSRSRNRLRKHELPNPSQWSQTLTLKNGKFTQALRSNSYEPLLDGALPTSDEKENKNVVH